MIPSLASAAALPAHGGPGVLSLGLFLALALATVVSAGIVVFSRNLLYAGFSLAGTFFGVAGLFVFLRADFLAAGQVLVYVGGILVLILFAVMFSRDLFGVREEGQRTNRFFGALVATCAFFAILQAILTLPFPASAGEAPLLAEPSAGALGRILLSRYLLAFEAVSVLLLAVLVAALHIVRKDTRGKQP